MPTLYTFTGTNDGSDHNGLVLGSDGFLYGTTQSGGTNGWNDDGAFIRPYGTVFRISTNGVLTSIYSFGFIQDEYHGALDGAEPEAGLAQGSDGNFYGTTTGGYNEDYNELPGTVFKITTSGTLTTLNNDTGNPVAALAQGADGNFYGTTPYTVFKITTNGTLTTLRSFDDSSFSGYDLYSALVQGSDGNFYGTTIGGGTNGSGTVFAIGTNGVLTTLHSFTGGISGRGPAASLVQGSDGNFYGTTENGGINNSGTVFKISADGAAFTTLYVFSAGIQTNEESEVVTNSDGAYPRVGLILVGNTLYGTTSGAAATVMARCSASRYRLQPWR